MIYDFPESSSPIAQGDIFFSIPILDLPDDELSIVDDASNVRTLPWETFASEGEPVSAIVAVRPTIAIVGTQECDALRAPNITLFEVRPFRDVERKSKETTKPSKWVPIITQHARINQKWFYLPADEKVGFGEKMGADFLTPIRVPRLTLERLLSFRKGRLNEIAKQHFRERLAEFFRRYAYDEWYALTREELVEYQKTYRDAEPFPWQRDNPTSPDGSKAVAEGNEAVSELAAILSWVSDESEKLGFKLTQYTSQIAELNNETGKSKADEYTNIASLAASDMNTFSKAVEVVLPTFEKKIQVLAGSCSTYVLQTNSESIRDAEQVLNLRGSLSEMLDLLKPAKESMAGFKESTVLIRKQSFSDELSRAAGRQVKTLEKLITDLERMELHVLRVIFQIDEKFGKPPTL